MLEQQDAVHLLWSLSCCLECFIRACAAPFHMCTISNASTGSQMESEGTCQHTCSSAACGVN